MEPQALRGWLRRADLADGVRRRGSAVQLPGDPLRRARGGAGGGPCRRDRAQHGRADDHRPRHGGAEGALPPADPRRRRDLVPGLLGAGRGLRPRRRAHARRAPGRRLRRQRAEGVVVLWSHRRLLHPRHPERPGRGALPEPHVPARRHARARRRGPAAAPDHGRGGVQRDLLLGCRGARRKPPRRRGRWLAGGDDDAPARARDARLRAHGDARRALRAAAGGNGGARARAARARRARTRMDRAAGAPLHELPRPRHLRAHRRPRPGRLGCEAALVGGEPAADEARARVARAGRHPRRRLVEPPAASQPRQHDRGRDVGGLAQHHRRARPGAPEVALMDFALNDDQLELKQAARAWLADRFPLDRDWEAQDDRWSELEELGWLNVAEAGLGFVEEALLLEEMGYVCYPGFYLGHVASVPGDGDLATVDPTRRFNRVEETPRFRAAAAAEALGVAQRALDLGVEHAKTRTQFGTPIGQYQAVSHPLAQTYTDVELARSLVYWAAWCVAEEDERSPLAAAAAKAFATEAAVAACERSIQVHAGIRFTWEHPLHRFYKRALWLEGFGRRPAELRLEVADAVLA